MKSSALLPTLALLLAPASPAATRPILDGPAIVVGFHVTPPLPSESFPLPRRPADIVARAPDAGAFDVWLLVFTRAPLVGAWTLNVALDYDGTPGRGVDLLEWESLADHARPRPGWPDAGAGGGCEFIWNRERCFAPTRGLLAVADGWWLQVAARLRVAVHGPDRLGLADPEPNVRPQQVECFDEYHPLDGTDNWTGVVPALFGAEIPVTTAMPRPTPVRPLGWSALKIGRLR